MTPDPVALLSLASATAREAGAMVAARAGHIRTDVGTKSTPTDMVTEVDRDSEALIVARILAARPADAILGEEGGGQPGTSGVRWVIDPLDGTTNYLYGYPAYAVSIAAEFEGVAVAGVVFDASRGDIFEAALGRGATLNGQPIRVSGKRELASALTGTGFGYDPQRRALQGAVLASLLPHIRDIRRGGSAALDLCAVACGRLDAFFELGLGPWDWAAAALIIREAGGATFARIEDGTISLVAAGDAELVAELRDLVLRFERDHLAQAGMA